jgi:hypothetical protein
MPLILWQAFAWGSSIWGGWILPLLAKVPWQVWAAIAGVIAVLYYGHVRENRGYARCQTATEEAQRKEVARQDEVASAALNAARERERLANQRASEAQDELGKLQGEVDKLKTAKTVCLPGSITKQYRNR